MGSVPLPNELPGSPRGEQLLERPGSQGCSCPVHAGWPGSSRRPATEGSCNSSSLQATGVTRARCACHQHQCIPSPGVTYRHNILTEERLP